MVSPLRNASPEPRRDGVATPLWAMIAAFGTYFSMYLFRKPFTVGTYEGMSALGIDLKTVLVTSQIFGYFLSKLIGIKIVSEMPPERRAIAIYCLVLAAEAALLLFAFVPPPWNVFFLFLNGLPLGMVFGLVVSFLEGRKSTELLTAGLCTSFILADGVAKSLGQWLLDRQVSVFRMPFTAGLVGLIPLTLFVWMLSRIPAPTTADAAARSHRAPMTAADRRRLCTRYAPGILAIVLAFVVTTVLRSIRADFAPELWKGFGEARTPHLFTLSETLVALGVMAVSGLTVLVRDNRQAFFLSLAVCLVGFGLLLGAVAGWETGRLSGFATMVGLGLGLYLPYVVVHTTVFERLLAMTREKGTLAFLMTLADTAGYLGYIAVMLAHNVIARRGDVLSLFEWVAVTLGLLSIVSLVVAMLYFARRGEAAASPLATSGAAS